MGEVARVHSAGSIRECVSSPSRPTSNDWLVSSQGTITVGSTSLVAHAGMKALSISPKDLNRGGRDGPDPLGTRN